MRIEIISFDEKKYLSKNNGEINIGKARHWSHFENIEWASFQINLFFNEKFFQ